MRRQRVAPRPQAAHAARVLALALMAAALGLVVTACGSSGETARATSTDAAATGEAAGEGPRPGGTYRVDVETSFDFTDAFDPTGEYTSLAWSFYTLLVRRLMAYRGTAGAAGNEPLPDLATGLPTISPDGTTYTFTLKDGVRFGPPVDREITSKDILYAFERLADPDLGGAGYPNYYADIVGFDEYGAGEADTIAGIETPDDRTVVFRLERPVGDFLYRLAMPATGPIPEEVAKCFAEPGEYGRFLVSSGPYMIDGSDTLDITSCETMRPITGFDPERSLALARNPSYDPSTDSTELRENFPDRFEFLINTSADDCFARVRKALVDDTVCGETGKQLREYTQDEDLADNLKLNPDDTVWYLSMNLAVPPFDDVHVRRAANLVMDRAGLVRAWGGPTAGSVATHVLPPSLAPPSLEGYDPYPSPGGAGDAAAATEEMKLSRYDTDRDGLCDAPECKDVLNVMGVTAHDRLMIPVMEESLGRIGITLKTRQLDDPYSVIFTPTEAVPLTGVPGWGKDYPDPSTFFGYLFDSRGIAPDFSYNQSLVGLTPAQAAEIGIPYPADGVPSLDAGIDECASITDTAARGECWGALTRTVMEDVVPWVPYLWSTGATIVADSVTKWQFDQSTVETAWAHVAVDPAKQSR